MLEKETLEELSSTGNVAGVHTKNFIGKSDTKPMEKNGYTKLKEELFSKKLKEIKEELDIIRKQFNT